MGIKELEKQLKDVVKERQRVAAEVEKAGAVLSDKGADLKALRGAAEGLPDKRRDLTALDDQLRSVQSALTEAKAEANREKVLELRQEEQRAYDVVKAKVDDLEPALEYLNRIHQQIVSFGSGPMYGDGALHQAIIDHRKRERLKKALASM